MITRTILVLQKPIEKTQVLVWVDGTEIPSGCAVATLEELCACVPVPPGGPQFDAQGYAEAHRAYNMPSGVYRIVELGADANPKHQIGDLIKHRRTGLRSERVVDSTDDENAVAYFVTSPVRGGTFVRRLEYVRPLSKRVSE